MRFAGVLLLVHNLSVAALVLRQAPGHFVGRRRIHHPDGLYVAMLALERPDLLNVTSSPGTTVVYLHGKQKPKKMCRSKAAKQESAVLFK